MMLGTVAQGGIRFLDDGTPDWVPEGAFAYLDFTGNRYYAGGAQRTIEQVLSGYDPAHRTGSGLYVAFDGSNGPLAAGNLLSDIAAAAANGMTIVFELDCISGWNGQLFYFLDAETAPSASEYIETGGSPSGMVMADFYDLSISLSSGINASGANKFAWTINRDIGGGDYQWAGSVNGGAAVSDTVGYNYFSAHMPAVEGFQIGGYSTMLEIDAYFRKVTFYTAAVDPSLLPGLSA